MKFTIQNAEINIKGNVELEMPNAILEQQKLQNDRERTRSFSNRQAVAEFFTALKDAQPLIAELTTLFFGKQPTPNTTTDKGPKFPGTAAPPKKAAAKRQ